MEKKLISLVLAVLMIMSILPMSAFAAQNLPESDGVDQEWVYEAKAGNKSLRITFDGNHDDELVDNCSDRLDIYDQSGNLRLSSLCSYLCGKTIDINSKYVKIVYTVYSNYYSEIPCGFKITRISECSEFGNESSVLCFGDDMVTETRFNSTVTFSSVGDSEELNYAVVANVDWVKHIVVKGSFKLNGSSFDDFVNVTSFDLPEHFMISWHDLVETAFYKDISNWENESLYLGTRLLKLGDKDEIKDGTTDICNYAIYHREEIFIPDSVRSIAEQYNCKSFLCSEESDAWKLATKSGIEVYCPGSLKVKLKNSVINKGTVLSEAIDIFRLSNDYNWDKLTTYSASGYNSNKVGEIQNIKITAWGQSTTFDIVLSDANKQYINFNDAALSAEVRRRLGLGKNSVVSVDSLRDYNGELSIYNVNDISGLEYAESVRVIYSYDRSFISPRDYFSLQKFSNINALKGATVDKAEYGRFDMSGICTDVKYTLSDYNVASIDKQGIITTKKVGETVVTASIEDISKSFKLYVYSTDVPVGEKTDKVPSIVAGNLINTADGDLYQIIDGNLKKEESDTKVIMSTDYIDGRTFNVYYGYYYLTDTSELWVASTKRGSTMKLGEGYKKVSENSKLALKKDNTCWDLETRTKVAENVLDICGDVFLTTNGEIYGVNYKDEVTLIDKNVRSIVNVSDYQCFYTKVDGKTYCSHFSCWLDSPEIEIKKCADRFATDIYMYMSYYYYTDKNNDLYLNSFDGQEIKICSDVIELKDGCIITKDKSLFTINTIMEKVSENIYDIDIPDLKNVEKITKRFYIDTDKNLYTSEVYKYSISSAIRFGKKIPKLMSEVVDIKEGAYRDRENDLVEYAIFTRTDGSVWYYDFKSEIPIIIFSGNNAELGDVNADGVINSVDALRVLQHSVDIIQLQGRAAKRADVNEDKIINSNDALNILRYSVGLITDFSEIK